MYILNLIELTIIIFLTSPFLVDNTVLVEISQHFNSNSSSNKLFIVTPDEWFSVTSLLYNWIKSVAADEGHHEIGIIMLYIFWLPSLVNVLTTICPLINENNECDTLLLFADVFFIGLGFIFLIAPIYGYYTVVGSITWTIPVIFNLFLPAIEVWGKLLRAGNIALRLSSNLTAGHLLMLLLASFGEVLLNSQTFILKFLGFILFNFSIAIICLESFLACVQTYVWSILVLYYLNQDE